VLKQVMACAVLGKITRKAQLTQRERATAVHVWKPGADFV